MIAPELAPWFFAWVAPATDHPSGRAPTVEP